MTRDFWEGYVPEPQYSVNCVNHDCEKCKVAAQRQWVGLTDEERKFVRNSVGYNQFVTASEYAEHVQEATEDKLKEKNT